MNASRAPSGVRDYRIRLMTSASRYLRLLWTVGLLAVGITMLAGYRIQRIHAQLPHVPLAPRSLAPGRTPYPPAPSSQNMPWEVLAGEADPPQAAGALAKRVRFAGAFFTDYAGQSSGKAVIDLLESHTQEIVSEKQQLGDITVVRIFRDHIILRGPEGEEELWLSFRGYGKPANAGTAAPGENEADGEPTKFGRKLGETSWLFRRDAMLSYHRELMDDPARLVAVFDSLKPLRDAQQRITGYQLGIEGEQAFFDAVGFAEGDVVRKVNSLDMTNRRRAEHFIKMFVEDKMTAFVIDIERNGKPQRMVYQIR